MEAAEHSEKPPDGTRRGALWAGARGSEPRAGSRDGRSAQNAGARPDAGPREVPPAGRARGARKRRVWWQRHAPLGTIVSRRDELRRQVAASPRQRSDTEPSLLMSSCVMPACGSDMRSHASGGSCSAADDIANDVSVADDESCRVIAARRRTGAEHPVGALDALGVAMRVVHVCCPRARAARSTLVNVAERCPRRPAARSQSCPPSAARGPASSLPASKLRHFVVALGRRVQLGEALRDVGGLSRPRGVVLFSSSAFRSYCAWRTRMSEAPSGFRRLAVRRPRATICVRLRRHRRRAPRARPLRVVDHVALLSRRKVVPSIVHKIAHSRCSEQNCRARPARRARRRGGAERSHGAARRRRRRRDDGGGVDDEITVASSWYMCGGRT